MPYWPPDTPPTEPEQMPAAGSGPAPVPYAGPGFALAPSMLAPVPDVSASLNPGHVVVHGTPGHAAEAPLAAPNVNPYAAGAVSPIHAYGDADPGGRDNVAGSVAEAVSNAMARLTELQGDTYGQGSRIGDLMTFPGTTATGAHLDPGVAPGITEPAGALFEPPRNYSANPNP